MKWLMRLIFKIVAAVFICIWTIRYNMYDEIGVPYCINENNYMDYGQDNGSIAYDKLVCRTLPVSIVDIDYSQYMSCHPLCRK